MEKKDLRIVFMGTPEFAVESLKSLVEGGYNVVAVVTQPDKPVGRHQDTLQAPPVKQYALEQGLPVLQPVKMKDPEFVEQLRGFRADLQVVVAFRMLPEVVWAMPRFGTFNVHAALLPQYRGAAPINDADVEYVYDGLMHLGAGIALKTIDKLIAADGNIDSISQDELVAEQQELHHAPKIFKETCRISFGQPAKKVYDFIRGLSPYPGAWTEIQKEGGKAQVLKVFKTTKTGKALAEGIAVGSLRVEGKSLLVACADEWLQLDTIQISGKKRMEARDFLNGMRDIEQYKNI